jgi:hypothetical protein
MACIDVFFIKRRYRACWALRGDAFSAVAVCGRGPWRSPSTAALSNDA